MERIAEAVGYESPERFVHTKGASFSKNTLRSWMAGKTSPGFDDLVELARLTGRDVSFFVPQKEAPFAIKIQKLDVRAAAGGGAVSDVGKVEQTLEFPLWMVRKLAQHASRLSIIRAHGDSMEPTIRSGALVLVDENERCLPARTPKPKDEWDNPDIYVFLQHDHLRIKRLRVVTPGVTIIISDNKAYDPEVLDRRDRHGFKIIGRVVWWDNRL
jgi:phage repressor protein C with HTH and peptisase S24 domain